jgi:hypothetical protein
MDKHVRQDRSTKSLNNWVRHIIVYSTFLWLMTTLHLSPAKPSLERYAAASDYL